MSTEFTRDNLASRLTAALHDVPAFEGLVFTDIVAAVIDELALVLADQALNHLRGPWSRDTAMSWLNAADALTVPETVPVNPLGEAS
jgi:hypothetical protein